MHSMRIVFIALATSLLLASCNTMSGVGKDLQAGGEKLENSAEKNKGNNSKR